MCWLRLNRNCHPVPILPAQAGIHPPVFLANAGIHPPVFLANAGIHIYFLLAIMLSLPGLASSISDDIQSVARKNNLPPSIFNIHDSEVDFNLNQFGSHLLFRDALDRGLSCLLRNPSGVDSPLQIVMEEYQPNYSVAKDTLRQLMGHSNSSITLDDRTERGDDVAEYWIFSLLIPEMSDHQFWSVVDRENRYPTECFGFN